MDNLKIEFVEVSDLEIDTYLGLGYTIEDIYYIENERRWLLRTPEIT